MSFLDRPRALLATTVQHRIAGEEFEAHHRRIWYTPGPRWWTAADPIWRVHNDVSMFAGGIRALLLQSLHPVAMAAVSAHSGFRGDPWGRLHRTSQFLATTTYGTVSDAEDAISRVRSIHNRVRGVTPEGVSYRASDPDLLSWIHLAEIDSFLSAYQELGGPPLEATEADTYVAQTAEVADRLGVLDPPRSTAELRQQLDAVRPTLRMTVAARETTQLLLREPPLGGFERAGYAVLAAGAVSLLPSWARAELGLPSLPITDRLVTRRLTRTALRTIRWALAGVPPAADSTPTAAETETAPSSTGH